MSVQALSADGWKIVLANATGPASTVSVNAGSAANVDLTVSANPANIREILALKSIGGLPDGIVLVSVSYPNISTIRLRVFNTTGSSIDINANSVSATILARAF
jgi:hypothetical protein